MYKEIYIFFGKLEYLIFNFFGILINIFYRYVSRSSWGWGWKVFWMIFLEEKENNLFKKE